MHKIKTEFSLHNATNFGGVKVFLEYLEKIKLTKTMRNLSGGKAFNSVFPLPRILLYLIVGWMLGC
ncbi:IS1380 family transposase, partial [Paenibacillaceae bacterium T2]|nr:IS1380 family transposase [Paenibacillaceae bacterium T2]